MKPGKLQRNNLNSVIRRAKSQIINWNSGFYLKFFLGRVSMGIGQFVSSIS